MKSFYVPTDSLAEAKKLLSVLADYDAFQYENNIKPDYSNAGGLQEYNEEEGEWWDYEDSEGLTIDEIEL
jgi:hypothetical protein